MHLQIIVGTANSGTVNSGTAVAAAVLMTKHGTWDVVSELEVS